MVCSKCGANMSAGDVACQFCGTQVAVPSQPSQQQFQQPQPQPQYQQPTAKTVEQAIPGFAHLKPYYQHEFRKIFESNEIYKGKWNWASFFFGVLWCFSKSLWGSGILAIVLGSITVGGLFVIYPFYYGVRGNYLYYKLITTNQQPWI